MMSFQLSIAFETEHGRYWRFKILVTQSAIPHSVQQGMSAHDNHLFQNWLGMLCKEFAVCFFPSYHTTLSVQFFMFSFFLYLKNISSFQFTATSFRNKKEASGTSSFDSLGSWPQAGLRCQHHPPRSIMPCLPYFINSSKYLLTSHEQHTGPLHCKLHNMPLSVYFIRDEQTLVCFLN